MQINTPFSGAEIPAILTKQQAARYAYCSTRYLELRVKEGPLKALKPSGRFIRFRRADLDKFLESGATIGGDV
jgi:excisionase family DNA binding protein